jgi:hypothetical protein
MAEKTDEQLLDIFAKPGEWTPEALDAARAELRQRALPLPPEPVQQTTSPPQEVSRYHPLVRRIVGAAQLIGRGGAVANWTVVVIWGILFVLGGVSGRFVLRGTNDSDALMLVGCGMAVGGIFMLYRRS